MKSFINIALTLVLLFITNMAIAVDETSNAYQTGNIIGKIFIAVLVILIIKKLFFKK